MRISVIQMCPTSDKALNIDQARQLVNACISSDRPDMIVLPEVWTCLGGDRQAKFDAAELIPRPGSDETGGEAYRFLQDVARSNGIYVHGGSIGERDGDRLLNTTVMLGPTGQCLGRYSKIHLFDITTLQGTGYRESETYRAGDEVVTVRLQGEFAELRVGLAICYDIRFGELFYRLRQQGADIILLPAAFTAETGEAHWETLVRARAIETQCWFAAAGTVGAHQDADNRTRFTYGNSMIVDPWGAVVSRASSGTGWTTGRIDTLRTARIRASIPVMDHRRLA